MSKRGMMEKILQKQSYQDLPGGPVVKTLPSSAGSMSPIPGRGTKIPHATVVWPKCFKK